MSGNGLAEHYFRHEYGRLVAVLCRRVGMQHLDAVEDAVQAALVAALEVWPRAGEPASPGGWLYRVALNRLLDELRQVERRTRLSERHGQVLAPDADDPVAFYLAADVKDDLLRLLFACCDESIPVESQLAFALKTVCGFDVREISQRLFASEAAVTKRLTRARNRLLALRPQPDALGPEQIAARLPTVQAILYTMFTEGHLSSRTTLPLRRDLCNEAKRLARLLAEHPLCGTPETCALMALMHLHNARMQARQEGARGLLLLDEQDRLAWDRDEIGVGLAWLARSAQGPIISRFHAEAGIAAEHCLAPSLAETRWECIVECYELLERTATSALHRLGKAVALAEWRGPAEGLSALNGFVPPRGVAESYLCHAVLAELHRRCGHWETAREHFEAALDGAPAPAIRAALIRCWGNATAGLPAMQRRLRGDRSALLCVAAGGSDPAP